MSERRWLALDGALGTFSAAVRDGDRVVAGAAGGKEALERGLSIVSEVLQQAGLALRDIDAIAVGAGPGSFTGLRIGASFAKGLALALGRPLAGVSSYDVLDGGSAAPPVLAVAHGRPDIACARLRTEAAVLVRCGGPSVIAGFVAEHVPPGDLTVCGALQGVLERLGERGFNVRAFPVPECPARMVAQLAAERFAEAMPPARVHELVLDYGELPAAEVRRGGFA